MDATALKALGYEKDGMGFADAMRLANLERLAAITPLSMGEEKELKHLQEELEKLRGA